MTKEKKISTSYTVNELKKDADNPYQVKCRIVFNRLSTKFSIPLVNGKFRCDSSTYEMCYKDNEEYIKPFDNWIRNIVRFEYSCIGEKKDYDLKGLPTRLPDYLKSVNSFFERGIINDTLKVVDDVISHRKYMRLESLRNTNVTSLGKYSEYFKFIEFYRILTQEYGIDIMTMISKDDVNLIKSYITFLVYNFTEINNKESSYITIFGDHINRGEWIVDDPFNEKWGDFLIDRNAEKPIELPQLGKEYIDIIKEHLPKQGTHFSDYFDPMTKHLFDSARDSLLYG